MNSKLAIHGGTPIRQNILQYGKQTIDQSDKEAVLSVLDENNFLTTGPKVSEFEEKCKKYCGAKYAIAVNSCTAALHCAVASLNLKETDEVIVSSISFVASANCILYCNAVPVFCDVEEDTMNIDPKKIEILINENTKAIIAVDFAGQICDFENILKIAKKYNLVVIEDAAHSWGVKLSNKYVGNICDITTLSFHPVKNMTTCEGGMILTNNEDFYNKMLSFRQHGIVMDHKKRDKEKQLVATMDNLGFNYRIPDILCSLGISQLSKLDDFISKRLELSNIYKNEINKLNYKYNKELVTYLNLKNECTYHIFVIKLNLNEISVSRDEIFHALKAENIGVNLHYIPIYKHPYYVKKFPNILLPICEKLYSQILTLPLYPNMSIYDINDVINALDKVLNYYIYFNMLFNNIGKNKILIENSDIDYIQDVGNKKKCLIMIIGCYRTFEKTSNNIFENLIDNNKDSIDIDIVINTQLHNVSSKGRSWSSFDNELTLKSMLNKHYNKYNQVKKIIIKECLKPSNDYRIKETLSEFNIGYDLFVIIRPDMILTDKLDLSNFLNYDNASYILLKNGSDYDGIKIYSPKAVNLYYNFKEESTKYKWEKMQSLADANILNNKIRLPYGIINNFTNYEPYNFLDKMGIKIDFTLSHNTKIYFKWVFK